MRTTGQRRVPDQFRSERSREACSGGRVKGKEGQDDVGDSASPSAAADPSRELLEPVVGSYIDARYRVDGVLGCGGMAVVYAGEHLELQRAVAIKVLDRAHATDPMVVEHFLLEA